MTAIFLQNYSGIYKYLWFAKENSFFAKEIGEYYFLIKNYEKGLEILKEFKSDKHDSHLKLLGDFYYGVYDESFTDYEIAGFYFSKIKNIDRDVFEKLYYSLIKQNADSNRIQIVELCISLAGKIS